MFSTTIRQGVRVIVTTVQSMSGDLYTTNTAFQQLDIHFSSLLRILV